MKIVKIFTLLLINYNLILAEPLSFNLDCDAALLFNPENGRVLFEKEADRPFFPASLTKVATALYALRFHKEALEDLIIVEKEAIGTLSQEKKRSMHYTSYAAYSLEPDGTHINLKFEEEISLKDLLKGMLIPSGNDAANLIAHTLGPTIPAFMEKLNVYLNEIGCQNTVFYNPHGLHHPEHQTTAYDLGRMTQEALKEPLFCEIVKQTKYLRPKTNKQPAATYLQSNRLLRSGPYFYSKAIGVKTGYHSKAKHTFIGAASQEGRTLILVLLGYSDRKKTFADASRMFETAFNQPKVLRTYLKSGEQKFTKEIESAKKPLKTYLEEPLSLAFYSAEDPEAKCLLYWNVPPLPILKGQDVGELQLVSKQGEVLKKGSLVAAEDVPIPSFFDLKVILSLCVGGLFLIYLIVSRRFL